MGERRNGRLSYRLKAEELKSYLIYDMIEIMNYDEFREEIRNEGRNSEWKYLRESSRKFFDGNMNTELPCYLKSIFPDVNDWIYDKAVPRDILEERKSTSFRKFRPDARSEELSLIVEFDGLQHYQSPKTIFSDHQRDEYFSDIGYKVVRIPYFTRLSKSMIEFFFDVRPNDEYCELEYGLFDSPHNDFGIDVSPQSFSCLGMQKFLDEIKEYPIEERFVIKRDLELVSKANLLHIPAIPEVFQNAYDICMKD
jgi:hypothetical protein